MATDLVNPISGITPSQLSQPFTRGTSVATTSGTAIDFTGIPSWVKRITMLLNGVSTSGINGLQIQIGSGSITASGYLGATFGFVGANFSTGVVDGSSSAANLRHGSIVFHNISGNTWVASGILALSNAAFAAYLAGSVPLSGTLDRIRLTTVGGTDTFDAGSVNIFYE